MQVHKQATTEAKHEDTLNAGTSNQQEVINQLIEERHENTNRMLEADSDCV